MALTKEDKREVRGIVREETADIRLSLNSLEGKFDLLDQKVTKLGVEFEDFGVKMDAIAELVATTVKTRNDVGRHEVEIASLKTDMSLVKSAIRHKKA